MKSFIDFVCEMNSEEKCIEFWIQKNVFKESMQCPRCGKQLSLNRETLLFRCNSASYIRRDKRKKLKVRCWYKRSVKTGTWLERVRLPLRMVTFFIAEWLWLPSPRFGFITDDLGIGSHSFVDWSGYCREVCLKWSEDNTTQLGGPDKIVEIDETKIGSRKYLRSRLVKGKSVLCGYERGSKKVFIVSLNDRTSEALLELIQQWILPGSIVMSDCWKVYNCLNNEGYKNLTTNRTYTFVNPDNTSRSIERTCSDIHQSIPKCGTNEEDLPSYLAEYLFKRCYSRPERIDVFFNEIAKFEVELDSNNGEGSKAS